MQTQHAPDPTDGTTDNSADRAPHYGSPGTGRTAALSGAPFRSPHHALGLRRNRDGERNQHTGRHDKTVFQAPISQTR